jgi:hypothetical protein
LRRFITSCNDSELHPAVAASPSPTATISVVVRLLLVFIRSLPLVAIASVPLTIVALGGGAAIFGRRGDLSHCGHDPLPVRQTEVGTG